MRYGPGSWGGAGAEGEVVTFSEKDRGRLGGNGKEIKKLDGLRALVVEHAGDYFHLYRVLERVTGGWRLGREFGAYVCGKRQRLSKRVFHLLMAGETVPDAEIKGPKEES